MVSRYLLKRRVLFHETDMAGVVHFSCFFRYVEEAEHALWREAGLSIAPRGSEIGWPRVAASCEFRRPLYFEEEFQVDLRIVEITDRRIRYSCAVVRGGETLATGSMTVACVTRKPNEPMRSATIPAEVIERLQVDTRGFQNGAADLPGPPGA